MKGRPARGEEPKAVSALPSSSGFLVLLLSRGGVRTTGRDTAGRLGPWGARGSGAVSTFLLPTTRSPGLLRLANLKLRSPSPPPAPLRLLSVSLN